MADDKQLTVAELLARSKREPGATPRRRRRNLESGGISVAELTGNLKRVEATPAQPKHSSVDIDETAPVIPAPADAALADAAPAQADKQAGTKAGTKTNAKPAAQAETKAEAKAESKSDAKAEVKADQKAKTPSVEETAVLSAIKDEPVQPAKAETAEAKAVAVSKDAADTESDSAVDDVDADKVDKVDDAASPNPVSVVMLALFGIVLGAVVFKGFEILWEHLNHILVAVLALATTGVITGLIHALSVDKKNATLILAAAVGLVLTFGPFIGMVL